MAILVRYKNNTFGAVSQDRLDMLIASREIIYFKRSDGWVNVSEGPLRGQGSPQQYRGPERRQIFSLV